MLSVRLLSPVLCVAAAALFLSIVSMVAANPEATNRARRFALGHEAKLRPLEKVSNFAWWNANVSGKSEDFKKKEEAQNRIDEALADPAAFRELKQVKDGGQIDDPILARSIDVLYLIYLEKQ